MPGKKYGNTEFDAFSEITWDLKTHASNSKSHEIICNDTEATMRTIADYGYYGLIVAVGEADYNDEDGTFRKWHQDLKGGLLSIRRIGKKEARNPKPVRQNSFCQKSTLLVLILTHLNNVAVHSKRVLETLMVVQGVRKTR